jgi:hypothetical protein
MRDVVGACLTGLEDLRLHLDFVDADLAHIRSLTSLKSLSLRDRCGGISGSGLQILEFLPRLTTVRLAFPALEDAQLQHLCRVRNLATLTLSDCGLITGAALRIVSGIPTITALGLASCPNIVDADLVHIGAMAHLTELSLNDMAAINGAGFVHLASLAGSLKKLSLDGSDKLTDESLVHVAALAGLDELSLNLCSGLTGAGLAQLRSLRSLTKLEIYGVNFGVTSGGGQHLPECVTSLIMSFRGSSRFALCKALRDALPRATIRSIDEALTPESRRSTIFFARATKVAVAALLIALFVRFTRR